MTGRAGVFLDRDGTIIELIPYLHEPERVALVPRAAESLRRLAEDGYALVVVTNQSGVARGYFTMEDVDRVNERMVALLGREGCVVDGIEICPHHPDSTGECECRKPKPGMLLRAADRLGLELSRSWVIGDRMEDLLAGRIVGCSGILVLTGYGREEALKAPADAWKAVRYVAWDLPSAVAYIRAARDAGNEPSGTSL